MNKKQIQDIVESQVPEEEIRDWNKKITAWSIKTANESTARQKQIMPKIHFHLFDKNKGDIVVLIPDAFEDGESREKTVVTVIEKLLEINQGLRGATMVSEVWMGRGRTEEEAYNIKESHREEGLMIQSLSLDLRQLNVIMPLKRDEDGTIRIDGEKELELFELHRLNKEEVEANFLAKLLIRYVFTKTQKGLL